MRSVELTHQDISNPETLNAKIQTLPDAAFYVASKDLDTWLVIACNSWLAGGAVDELSVATSKETIATLLQDRWPGEAATS